MYTWQFYPLRRATGAVYPLCDLNGRPMCPIVDAGRRGTRATHVENSAGWGGASSSRRHHALLTHSPIRNRHDAFHAAGTTTADPDDARTLLAVQKPTVAPGDDYSAVVEFTTGPNLFEYDFNVVCYEQDVAVDRSAVDRSALSATASTPA